MQDEEILITLFSRHHQEFLAEKKKEFLPCHDEMLWLSISNLQCPRLWKASIAGSRVPHWLDQRPVLLSPMSLSIMFRMWKGTTNNFGQSFIQEMAMCGVHWSQSNGAYAMSRLFSVRLIVDKTCSGQHHNTFEANIGNRKNVICVKSVSYIASSWIIILSVFWRRSST